MCRVEIVVNCVFFEFYDDLFEVYKFVVVFDVSVEEVIIEDWY